METTLITLIVAYTIVKIIKIHYEYLTCKLVNPQKKDQKDPTDAE